MTKLILTRDVSKKECSWLGKTFKTGDIVNLYEGFTYGCVSDDGEACTLDGETFFELPKDALQEIKNKSL
jgi:hypothetical protein